MTVTSFTPVASALGGALIGAAAVMLMSVTGRIAGVSGIAARLACFFLGLMFFLWTVLLHAPRVVTHLNNGDEWSSAFVALAMAGASILLLPSFSERT